jgi:hypothetical protein
MDEKEKPIEDAQNDLPEDLDESSWAVDQQKHDYYYDDSHGYEVYNPDEDEEDEKEA